LLTLEHPKTENNNATLRGFTALKSNDW